MQFSCDSCKAQLQIADEKVRGKRLIVRCKRCGAKIGIADPALGPPRPRTAAAAPGSQSRPAPASVPAPARAAPAATPARRDSDTESTRAMDAGLLEQALQASKADDPSLARASAAPAPPPSVPADEGAIWFAMIHGRQEGPMTRAELVSRAAAGAVGPRTYLWRDGMESWQRARELAELHDLFPQLPETAPPAAPAVQVPAAESPLVSRPPAAAAPESPRTSKPLAASAPESPRASKPPAGAAKARARASTEAAGLDLELGKDEDRVPLDPLPLAQQVQQQGVAEDLFSTGPETGAQKNGKDLASWASAELQKKSPRPRPPPRTAPMFESTAREQNRLPLVMVAVVAVLGAVVLVLWLIFGSGSAAKPPEKKPPQESGSAPVAPQKPAAPPEAKPPEKAPEQAAAKPPEKAQAPPTGLTADQVRRKLDENKSALQNCIDEALRRDPNMRVGKIHIATTIAPNGKVTAAKIDKSTVEQSSLGACLRQATRRIAFPEFSGKAFDVDIPIVVTAGE